MRREFEFVSWWRNNIPTEDKTPHNYFTILPASTINLSKVNIVHYREAEDHFLLILLYYEKEYSVVVYNNDLFQIISDTKIPYKDLFEFINSISEPITPPKTVRKT